MGGAELEAEHGPAVEDGQRLVGPPRHQHIGLVAHPRDGVHVGAGVEEVPGDDHPHGGAGAATAAGDGGVPAACGVLELGARVGLLVEFDADADGVAGHPPVARRRRVRQEARQPVQRRPPVHRGLRGDEAPCPGGVLEPLQRVADARIAAEPVAMQVRGRAPGPVQHRPPHGGGDHDPADPPHPRRPSAPRYRVPGLSLPAFFAPTDHLRLTDHTVPPSHPPGTPRHLTVPAVARGRRGLPDRRSAS
ncbi:hypothetical protein SBRY_10955 [Actinacidiphila bryophytorum]|uniref:Uncharacterized protein n=1 Tax=Actinacidiphila bryophytorum TaxID=1436133 RepID=A0A9W4ECG2_9ACTN|nr:hypothetical protein SBRY_10955 [Actinacidiphila bryophytorum]